MESAGAARREALVQDRSVDGVRARATGKVSFDARTSHICAACVLLTSTCITVLYEYEEAARQRPLGSAQMGRRGLLTILRLLENVLYVRILYSIASAAIEDEAGRSGAKQEDNTLDSKRTRRRSVDFWVFHESMQSLNEYSVMTTVEAKCALPLSLTYM